MRGGGAVAVALVALLVSAPQAGAADRPIDAPWMTVTAAPHDARAHAVRLVLTLHYEMQCGYPGAGRLVVTFPSALQLPARLAAGAVRLAGKPVAARVDGRRVTVVVPRHKGLMCDVIGPGSLALAFTRAAKLVNPKRAGSYGFRATHKGRSFAARLRIEPAG